MENFVIVFQVAIILIICWKSAQITRGMKVDNIKNKPVRSALDNHFYHPSYSGKLSGTLQRKWIRNDLYNGPKKTTSTHNIMINSDRGLATAQLAYSNDYEDMKYHLSSKKRILSALFTGNYNYKRAKKRNKGYRAARNVDDYTNKERGKTTLKNTTEIPLLYCHEEYSCRNHCHVLRETSESIFFPCQCDTDCQLFKDCCADYQIYCKNNLSESSVKLDQRLFSCLQITSKTNLGSFWAVNKCPEVWKPDEISLKCQNISKPITMDNIRSHVPVIAESKTIYRNEYCARCNEARVIDYFDITTSSDSLIPSKLNTTMEEAVTLGLKHGLKNDFFITPKDRHRIRKCLPRLIESCPQGYVNETKLCLKNPVGLVASYKDPRNIVSYKNIWCSYCWNELHANLKCGPYKTKELTKTRAFIFHYHAPLSVTFSIAIDFRSNGHSSVLISCPGSWYTYDPQLKVCRSKSYHEPVIPFIEPRNFSEKHLVVVWLQSQSRGYKLIDEKDVANFRHGVIYAFKTLFEISRFVQRQDIEMKTVASDKFLVSFYLYLKSKEILSFARESVNKIIKKNQATSTGIDHREIASMERLPLKRLLHFSKEFNITLSNTTFTVVYTTSRKLSCVNGKKFFLGQYTFLTNGRLYINSTGKTIPERQVIGGFFNKDTGITVCKKIVFSICNGTWNSFVPKEYRKFDNLSIFLKSRNKTYDFGDYDLENGSVMICTEKNWSVLPKYTVRKLRMHQVTLAYLTFVTFLISIVSLSFVILTYAVFKELRGRLPGKNILNLSISLNLSQILWLAAVSRPYTQTICHVTAVVEHYLFLVSFVGMAIISFHSRSVLTSKNVSRGVPSSKENKRFIKYCAIVWGMPVIFVSTCVLLDSQEIYSVYVNEKIQVCWLNNEAAQLYLFVLPTGLILAFNIISFVLTIIHISRQRAETGSILTNASNERSNSMLWVYIKLSSLMGFCWLFGYLDILIDSTPVFSYLFVIFASLQGFYIAVAFLLNKRVLKLYKKLQRKCGNRRRKPDYKSTLINYNNTRETRL